MIEIVFNESAGGSLKCAKSYKRGSCLSGCVSVFIRHSDGSEATKEELKAARQEAERKERLAWEKAEPLEGKSGDVFTFSLALSIGGIEEDNFWENRQKVLERLYGAYEADGRQTVQETLTWARYGLETVFRRADQGENIRIWYSSQPDELCGLYWFMAQISQLKDYSGKICFVKIPEWEMQEGEEEKNRFSIIRKSGWGDVSAEEWSRYLPFQRTISLELCRSLSADWRELQKENAPLRAELNGRLMSMPKTLYDEIIRRELSLEKEEFHEARLIGRILGKYRLGIGDAWIAYRIETMIADGSLQVISEAGEDRPRYCRVLRKSVHKKRGSERDCAEQTNVIN